MVAVVSEVGMCSPLPGESGIAFMIVFPAVSLSSHSPCSRQLTAVYSVAFLGLTLKEIINSGIKLLDMTKFRVSGEHWSLKIPTCCWSLARGRIRVDIGSGDGVKSKGDLTRGICDQPDDLRSLTTSRVL
jgi:hypothetical protein